METTTSNLPTTASTPMASFIVLYDLHTKFFAAAIEGISDKDAHNRLNTKANHVAWLTGSLVQQRYEIAKDLGINNNQQKANDLFKDNKGIQENVTYPALAHFQKDWNTISPLLRNALSTVTDDKLNSAYEMPGMKMSLFDMITFMIYREANIIGQLALWRRLLGYEAMKYM